MAIPTEQRDHPVGAEEGRSGPPRRWSRIYAAVLAHLALWIGLLWAFSRSFGSAP